MRKPAEVKLAHQTSRGRRRRARGGAGARGSALAPRRTLAYDVAPVRELALLGVGEAPYPQARRAGFPLGVGEAPLVAGVGLVGVGLGVALLEQELVEHLPAAIDVGEQAIVQVNPLHVELETYKA
jgi:hypothetical protein